MIVPDVVEPIVGWRLWRLRGMFVTPPRLESWVRNKTWPAREEMRAHCVYLPSESASHLSPGDSFAQCSCGVYAKRTLGQLLAEYEPMNTGYVTVVGEVDLWGTVVEGERGYRATRGYPRRVWILTPRSARGITPHDLAERAALELGDEYGIPATATASLLRVAWEAGVDEESRRWAGMTLSERVRERGPICACPDRVPAPLRSGEQGDAVMDHAATEMGRRGGLKGGKARAEKLTPEQRSESARAAAMARWHAPPAYKMPPASLDTLRTALDEIEREITQLEIDRAALRRILKEQTS